MAAARSGEAILVAVAWPYANGSLHLGHLAGSLLPPDIFARYHRAIGDRVLMVSGSDCHGTPIMVTAEKLGLTPEQVVDKYHAEHAKTLRDLGIQFDLFTKTTTENHRKHVQDVFLTLQKQGYLDERTTQGTYCVKDKRFLPDRYVEGTCPRCGSKSARGDQCDKCGATLDPVELKDPRCKHCGTAPEFRPTKHFFFRLTAFEERLKEWTGKKTGWRANTINFTQNWLKEGLKDRAITRDLVWGVPIPLKGYEDKRIYVWFEAVCGYLTASIEWAERVAKRPDAWRDWWHDPRAQTYYFLGKDNIPFHTIIWPAILMAYSDGLIKEGRAKTPLNLPTDVPANEFLTLSGQQFSKSRGIGIQIPDVLRKFDADMVRYYLSVNMPEQGDTDWSWEDFAAKVNDELVATFANYAHRVLTFAVKNFGGVPTRGKTTAKDEEALARITAASKEVGDLIAGCQFKKAIKAVMALAQYGNQYIDERAPWRLLATDRTACGTVINVGTQLVKALAVLMQPFLPTSAQRLWTSVGEKGNVAEAPWDAASQPVQGGTRLPEPKVLFERVDLALRLGGGATTATTPSSAAAPAKPTVALEEFQKLDLRIGRIVSVEDHPKADKLLVLRIETGDGSVRQVVAGMREHYPKKELMGRTVAFIANLAPATIRGVESQGMILGADDGKRVSVLSPDKDIAPGAKIR